MQKAYDQLDFERGVEAFITGMPAASVYGICGVSQRGHQAIRALVLWPTGDARTFWLTLNTDTVYAGFAST